MERSERARRRRITPPPPPPPVLSALLRYWAAFQVWQRSSWQPFWRSAACWRQLCCLAGPEFKPLVPLKVTRLWKQTANVRDLCCCCSFQVSCCRTFVVPAIIIIKIWHKLKHVGSLVANISMTNTYKIAKLAVLKMNYNSCRLKRKVKTKQRKTWIDLDAIKTRWKLIKDVTLKRT